MNWIKAKGGLFCLETGAKIYWIKDKDDEKRIIVFHEGVRGKEVLIMLHGIEEKDRVFRSIRELLEIQDPLNIS